MILGLTIHWKCDKCGYEKKSSYGAEKTNKPTIRNPPMGWVFVGDKVECGGCPDLSKWPYES
jgi:hypothetical protein